MRKKIIFVSIACVAIAALAIGAFGFNKQKDSSVKTFTAFFFSSGDSLDDDNDIQEIIASKVGARCLEQYSNGADQTNIINSYIAEGNYPDFISGNAQLYEADALIPLDKLINKYPNVKSFLTESEWDMLRQDDGHIYWIPQFSVVKNEDTEFIHDGEAFWIQTRVLKWANYPTIKTLDEYFDLLEAYYEANPYMEDGVTKNIPYTILCDDWRYFCLENVPQFLDGYPNDGSCIVNPQTMEVIDYNTTDTAKKYFKKLNEEYKKGIVDPESFTGTYDEYIAKLGTGAVLGMVDQRWDYCYGIMRDYNSKHLDEQGCEYVPLPITISEDITNQYHVRRSSELDASTGVAISISCTDPEGAMKFISDLLEEDIMLLRYWGVYDLDYSKDSDGVLYIKEDQSGRTSDYNLSRKHFCHYSFFPRYEGLMDDGVNSYLPEYQKQELIKGLSDNMRECFDAYGVESFVDFLGSNDKPGDWYPMYSFTDQLTYSSHEGTVYNQISELKHLMLPMVVMADDFEGAWNSYMEAYQECDPDVLKDAIQREVYKRMGED